MRAAWPMMRTAEDPMSHMSWRNYERYVSNCDSRIVSTAFAISQSRWELYNVGTISRTFARNREIIVRELTSEPQHR